MPTEVKVPSIGESITSGVLGVWRKKSNEFVHEGDVLFEIETDKVTSEVFAQASGVLEQLVPEGSQVAIGAVVGRILESATPPPKPVATAPSKPESAPDAPEPKPAPVPPASKPAPALASAATKELSPAVRRMVEESKLDPEKITGTGKGGRILKGDVISHVEDAATSASPASTAAPTPKPAPAPIDPSARTTRRKMTTLRRKIADRLVAAQQTAAILTTFNEVDMTNVMAMRARFQDRFVAKNEIKVGFMSFFVKAVVHALKAIPNINAKIEGDEVVQNHFYDIGVAIGTEKGLIVPVIRDADKLSYAEIEKTISDYAKRARAGKITLADLEGGVFTISNGGTYGSLLSTPILNPPQSGILGMHAIQERPMAINGRVEIRPMMYLALSYDHRLVDGKEAVTFLINVKEYIEQPGVEALGL